MTSPSMHDRCPCCGAASRYWSPIHAPTCSWYVDPRLTLTTSEAS